MLIVPKLVILGCAAVDNVPISVVALIVPTVICPLTPIPPVITNVPVPVVVEAVPAVIVTLPPNVDTPEFTFKAKVFVIVSFVPATGAPAIYTV